MCLVTVFKLWLGKIAVQGRSHLPSTRLHQNSWGFIRTEGETSSRTENKSSCHRISGVTMIWMTDTLLRHSGAIQCLVNSELVHLKSMLYCSGIHLEQLSLNISFPLKALSQVTQGNPWMGMGFVPGQWLAQLSTPTHWLLSTKKHTQPWSPGPLHFPGSGQRAADWQREGHVQPLSLPAWDHM